MGNGFRNSGHDLLKSESGPMANVREKTGLRVLRNFLGRFLGVVP
jgi:hypothetical protein